VSDARHPRPHNLSCASLQTQALRKRLAWTLASGFTVFLGGISWEGFGVFLSIILVVELWRFLTSETEDRLGYYLIWVLAFVPALYLASPTYRSGQGFATHISALMLIPPLGVLAIRTLRYLLLAKTRWADKLRLHSQNLALGLTLTSVVLALGYVLMQLQTFASTTVPFSQNQLMQSVVELLVPHFGYWVLRYGSIFFCCCIGMLIASIRLWKIHGVVLAVPLVLFHLTTFFRQPLDWLWGVSIGNLLFGFTIAGSTIALLLIAWTRKTKNPNELVYVAFTVWFLVWVALSRDTSRYDFFIGVPLAFFTTELIQMLAHDISQSVKRHNWQSPLKIGFTVLMLSLILFWNPVGGHATRILFTTKHLRKAMPGNNNIAKAFNWMRTELPSTAVVAANWSYGSMLNVLAGVKTIVDQDHYIPHWIHLYNQYIYNNTSEHEALEFLKSHNATHLMFIHGMGSFKAFLYGTLSDAFIPIYPTENFAEAGIKVWEIHYPPDIKPNPKYLATEPGE